MADPIDTHLDRVQIAPVNGIEIAYETFGDPTDPAIVLVMGLGTQMLGYHEGMCDALAASGRYVVRFDNRDVGLSTHWTSKPPSIPEMLVRRNPPYRLSDLADDALGLVDHLGLDRYDLVGTSMGGFISQTMAIARPGQVRTLTQVMTSTGSRRVGRPTPSVIRRMATASAPEGRDGAIASTIETYRAIGSPGFDEAETAVVAGWSYDRSFDPAGRDRQLAAILAQPDRTAALRRLPMPTLVVHGLADPLVAPSGGLAIANAVPGATFVGYQGKGHDLTRSTWERLTEDLLAHLARAEAAAPEAAPSRVPAATAG
jgi:pimeloyl-ACP methyl ester carboxylesterase